MKTPAEQIKEIHESFYTEGDKLLASAKIANNSLDADRQHLIEKCERLNALGFTNTKTVNKAKSRSPQAIQFRLIVQDFFRSAKPFGTSLINGFHPF